MKIFSPDMVADVKRQDTAEGESTSVVLHDHANKNLLDKFSIAEDGSLQFDSIPVGAAVDNFDVVSKLSAVNGALCYNGQPVDTVGFQFVNETVLDKFSVVDNVLYFDGHPVDTTGHLFSNAASLDRLGVDGNGKLTIDGAEVSALDPTALKSQTTAVFPLAAGDTVTIPHKTVDAGTVEYLVESLVYAGAVSKADRLQSGYTTSGVMVDNQALASSYARLTSTAYGTVVGPTNEGAAVATMNYSMAYVVDSTVYLVNGTGRAIYSAQIGSLPTFTSTGKTFPGSDSINSGTGSGVLRSGDTLYFFGQSFIYTASVSDPATWTSTGYANPNAAGAVFIVGQTAWLIGGGTSPRAIMSASLSNLGSWTTSSKTFPASNGFNQGACYQYKDKLYTITTCDASNSVGNAVYMASAADPTTWIQIGTFPHADWRMGIATVVNGAVICASGYYNGSAFNPTTEAFVANAENPATWTALTAMPVAQYGAAKFVVGNKVYIVDSTTLISYTVPPVLANGTSGVLQLAPLNLANVNPLSDVIVHANIPANTSIIPAMSLDGGATWKYWDSPTLTWVAAASQAAAFAAGAPLSLMSGTSQYRVAGLSNYDAGAAASITLAFRLSITAANTTPCIYSVIYTYSGATNVVPMVVGGLNSTKAEIGIQYMLGQNSSVQVKNLTADTLALRVKVQS